MYTQNTTKKINTQKSYRVRQKALTHIETSNKNDILLHILCAVYTVCVEPNEREWPHRQQLNANMNERECHRNNNNNHNKFSKTNKKKTLRKKATNKHQQKKKK